MSSPPVGTPYDLPRLQEMLRPIRVLHEAVTASTNDLARQLASEAGLCDETLILASEQTAGRGRGANQWWSAAGAVMFSALLDPRRRKLPPQRWPLVALTTAVAICDQLQPTLARAELRIKWPNDVYCDGRKLAGILVEPIQAADGANWLIVGVGLNLNNSLATAPPEVRSRAISVSEAAGGTKLEPTHFVGELWRQLDIRLQQLIAGDTRLAARWQQSCCLRGRIVTVEQAGRNVTGVCHGISADGALVIAAPFGGIERLYGGTVVAW